MSVLPDSFTADPDANESESIPIQPEQTLLLTYHPNYIKNLPVIVQTYLAHYRQELMKVPTFRQKPLSKGIFPKPF